jgi:tetratricopeptide (TPR) repeat protein
VTGEPGLGKSRLAWELEKYADGLAATVLWHYGQSLSFAQGAGFSALADMVRGRAQIDVKEPPGSQRTKLEALVNNTIISPDADSRARVLKALARLLGVDDGRERIDLGELFSSWRLLFEQLAERDPVLLVFEDLHWADQGLFDFIAHLCEWSSQSSILILVFSRPDERLAALKPLGQWLELSPLSADDIETLIAGAVEGAPASLVQSVREHAAGVPLFAIESLRMLAARGAMVAEGEAHRYRLVGEVHDLDVPPSIHALIAARVDQLSEPERTMLRAGAILGQRFSGSAGAAVAGVDEARVQPLLDGLIGKQFLAIDTDPRSASRGTYEFVHRQVQRVVLGTLSKRDRKARHLAAVDYLSRQAPDPDQAAILAEHLVAAFEAVPSAADAGEIRQRALALTLDAARRAEAVGALNEAVALFARAAEIETDERQRAEHFVRAGQCAARYGNQESIAAGHYAAARRLHESAGRHREALRMRARELHVYQWIRPPSELIAPLREVYDALSDESDAALADTAASLASALYADAQAEAAEQIAAQAVTAAREAGAYEELGVALNCRACALVELARPLEAVELFQDALDIRRRHAPSEVPGSLGNVAIALAAVGRFEDAVAAGRDAMVAAERVASRVHHNLAALQLARSLFSLGRWDEALSTVEEVAEQTAPANRGMLIGPPVLVAIHRGALERARTVIAEFDRSQAESGAAFESDYRSLREVALAHLAGAPGDAMAVVQRAQSGDYAEWPTWLPLAIDLIAGLEDDAPLHAAVRALHADAVPNTSPIVTAQIARIEAVLAARGGEVGLAAARWSRAVEIADEAGMVFDTAALQLECFEHMPRQDAFAGAREALETFTALGATPWMERAREATRTPAVS